METSYSKGFSDLATKKKGFTLAEVLITLTIIGVVAAMTIPTLMSKYQEKALESQFKKSYAIINQAFSLNSGYLCYWDAWERDGTQCPAFWESVLKELKYVKSEQLTTWPYKNQNEVLEAGGHVGNESCSMGLSQISYNYKYYLADGSIIILKPNVNYSAGSHFVLDVNGEKGPNKWGYDVFMLLPALQSDGSVRAEDSMCVYYEKGGKRPKNILTGMEKIQDNVIW